MKKLVALLLVLAVLVSMPLASLAAGKATITDEQLITTMGYSSVVYYYYAEVTNTGDKAVEIDKGILEMFDKDGELITSENVYNTYPQVLEPGQKAYICDYGYLDDVAAPEDVDDFAFNLTAATSKSSAPLYLTVSEVTCQIEKYSSYSDYYAVTAIIENNSEETVRDIYVVFAGRDAEGKLMYVEYTHLYDIGLLPGSKIEVKLWPDEESIWTANNSAPATIEAIAFGK